MSRWDKEGIPHKGWKYVGIIDLGEECSRGEDIEYEECEMCGQERIRFVHILTHPEFQGELKVGCDCASKMTDDYRNPEMKEKNVRNKANRRKNFMKQEWRRTQKGYTLRYKGEYITIVIGQYNSWGVVFKNEWKWEYNGRKIRDVETAKLVAFNLFDDLHEVQSSVNVIWNGERWIYN